MSACGFDNHLRRQLPDRQEQQTKETRMHLLAEESLICQADESAPHLERCYANSVCEYIKKNKKTGRTTLCMSVYECLGREICVRVCECLYSNRYSAVCPCMRLLMIKISQAACLCLAQEGEMEQQGRWTISPVFSGFPFFVKGSTLYHIKARVESGFCGFKSWKCSEQRIFQISHEQSSTSG